MSKNRFLKRIIVVVLMVSLIAVNLKQTVFVKASEGAKDIKIETEETTKKENEETTGIEENENIENTENKTETTEGSSEEEAETVSKELGGSEGAEITPAESGGKEGAETTPTEPGGNEGAETTPTEPGGNEGAETTPTEPEGSEGTETVQLPEIVLNNTNVKLPLKSEIILEVKAALEGESIPEQATIDWMSDNEEVATVSNGTVTAKKCGTATITATVKFEDQEKSISCEIEVVKRTAQSIEEVLVNYNNEDLLLKEDTILYPADYLEKNEKEEWESGKLLLKAKFEDGLLEEDCSDTVEWSVSGEGVDVRIENNNQLILGGLNTEFDEGKVTLTARINRKGSGETGSDGNEGEGSSEAGNGGNEGEGNGEAGSGENEGEESGEVGKKIEKIIHFSVKRKEIEVEISCKKVYGASEWRPLLDNEKLIYGDLARPSVIVKEKDSGDEVKVKGDVSFELLGDKVEEIAEFSKDEGKETEINTLSVGKFVIKASVAQNEYYNEKEVQKEYEISPKKLTINIAKLQEKLNDTIIEKESDGTTALTDSNKNTIIELLKLINLNGILEKDSESNLENNNSSKVYLSYDISDLDNLAYNNLDISVNEGKANNVISFNTLKISKELQGEKAGNYKLEENDYEELKGIKLSAKITAKPVEVNSYDMTTVSKEQEEQNIKVINIKVGGDYPQGAEFQLSIGKKGSNEGDPQHPQYWYDSKGIKVTKGKEDSKEVTRELLKVEKDGLSDALTTEDSVDNQYLNADSGTPLYIKVKEGEKETYYGPFQIKYQKDTTAPSIEVKDIELDENDKSFQGTKDNKSIIFGKGCRYTITLSDEESGVDIDSVRYYVTKAGVNGEDNIQPDLKEPQEVKTEIENGKIKYTFQVMVPESGKLYVQCSDIVGNSQVSKEIGTLVIEENKPKVEIKLDEELDTKKKKGYSTSCAKEHTFQIIAKDKDNNEDNKIQQSGIWKISYELTDEKGNQVKEAEIEYGFNTELSIEEIKTEQESEVISLSQDKEGKILDGIYTLTYWATDRCGNESDKSDKTKITLIFDNTPASVKVEMKEEREPDKDSSYYYRKDNCGLTVTFEDEWLIGGESKYIVEVSDESEKDNPVIKKEVEIEQPDKTDVEIAESKLDKTIQAKISFRAEEIATLQDGTITVTVTAIDKAGNQTEKLEKVTGANIADIEQTPMTAVFVLDKTMPQLTKVTSTETARNPYENCYYYNSEEVELTFYIKEKNISDQSLLLTYQKNGTTIEKDIFDSVKNNLKTQSSLDAEKNNADATYTFVIEEDEAVATTYTDFVISCEDKAGNKLILTEKEDNSQETRWQEWDYMEDQKDGTISMKYGKVLDTVPPKAVICFSKPYSIYGVTSYYGEGGFDVKIQFEDNCPLVLDLLGYSLGKANHLIQDTDKLTEVDYKEDSKLEWKEKKEDNLEEKEAKAEITVSEDGYYTIRVTGTDRAGNYINVEERIEDKEAEKIINGEMEEGSQKLYFVSDNKVIDTKVPEAVITFSELAENHIYGDGITSYYNQEISAEIEFTDNNTLDEKKLNYGISEKVQEFLTDDNKKIEESKWVYQTEDSHPEETNKETLNTTLKIPKEDGVYTVRIKGEDKAGNYLKVTEKIKIPEKIDEVIVQKDITQEDTVQKAMIVQENVPTTSEQYFVSGNKVYDTETPKAVITFTKLNKNHIYGANNLTSYYNQEISAEIEFTDNNTLNNKNLYYNKSKKIQEYVEDDNKKIEESKLTYEEEDFHPEKTNSIILNSTLTIPKEDGIYVVRIKGEDKAGNYLEVTEKIGEDKIVQENVQTTSGQYFVSGNKVYDTEAPKAVITFSELAKSHIYGKGITSYYNQLISAEIQFTDNNTLHNEKLKYRRSDKTQEPLVNENEKIKAIYNGTDSYPEETNKTVLTVLNSDKLNIPNENGIYAIKINGEDKAGNHLKVTEKIKISEKDEMIVQKDVQTEEEKAFVSGNKVYDTEAPTAIIDFSALDNRFIYGNQETIDGMTTSYYNVPYSAVLECSDNNLMEREYVEWQISEKVETPITDTKAIEAEYKEIENKNYPNILVKDGTKLTANIAMPQEDGAYTVRIKGEDKAGNKLKVTEKIGGKIIENRKEIQTQDNILGGYFITNNKVYDTINPVYFLTVTDPGESHVLDNTAYFNRDITASFSIQEINFDENKMGMAAAMEVQEEDYSSSQIVWTNVTMGNGWRANSKIYEQTVSQDGVYRFEIEGMDKAGNPLVPDTEEKKKTGYQASMQYEKQKGQYWSLNKVRDTQAPKGTLIVQRNVNGEIYYQLALETSGVSISRPYRSEKEALITMTTQDCSPVKIDYTMQSSLTDEKDVIYLGEEFSYQQSKVQSLNGEQVFRVKDVLVTDMAGNSIYMANTNRIYLDVIPPSMDELAPTIEIAAQADSNAHSAAGNPLFNRNVPLHIRVREPYAKKMSSGLSLISYELYINGELTDSKTLHEASQLAWTGNYEDAVLDFDIDETIVVESGNHNYNDILVAVQALDNASNQNRVEYRFGIDVTSPIVEINYDNNSAEHEKYFKEDRVATITVTERNFNPENTVITTDGVIGGWIRESGTQANGDDDRWITTVNYREDGIFTLEVSAADKVGNTAANITYSGAAPQDFVIDKTPPVVAVNFDNNDTLNEKYYNAVRTATISVDETNFEGINDIQVEALAGGIAPSVQFAGNTAFLSFEKDGIYSFSGTVTDMAGNISEIYTGEQFVVDLTPPQVKIQDVIIDEKTGIIQPIITINDDNLDINSLQTSVKLTRTAVTWDLNEEKADVFANADVREQFVPDFVINQNELGTDSAKVQFTDPERIQKNDGIYKLEVEVYDMAGHSNKENEDDQGEVKYVVNRFGTVYEYSDGLLKMNKERYCQKEGEELYITAYNASPLEEDSIKFEVRCDGAIVKEKSDLIMQEPSNSSSGWYEYRFDVDREYFSGEENQEEYQDGRYEFVISDKDKSGNIRTNSEQPLWFYIDSSKPVLDDVVGMEEIYYGTEKELHYTVSDTIGLADIKVYADDTLLDEVNFIHNVTEDNSNEQLENSNVTMYNNGEFVVSSGIRQNIRFVVADRAGNILDTNELTEDEIKKFSFKFYPAITVSTNVFKLWYAWTELFWGSIAGIVSVVMIVGTIIILKKRKKTEAD